MAFTRRIFLIFYHSSNLSIFFMFSAHLFGTYVLMLCTYFAAQSLNCLQSWQVMFFQKKSLVWARVLCTPTHDFKKMPKWHSAMHCQMFRASANPECLSKRGAQFGEIFLKGVFLCSGNWKFHVKFLEFLQF